MAKNDNMFVEDILRDAVTRYIDSRLDVVKSIGDAKSKLTRKEYKEVIGLSGLSKDQVSMCLKRFQLLQLGFGEHYISDYSDKMVKLLTNKRVEQQIALLRARKQLADNDIGWDEFKELYDTFNIIKTDNEKVVKKAEDLMSFIDNKNIGAEALLEVAELCKPLQEYLQEE